MNRKNCQKRIKKVFKKLLSDFDNKKNLRENVIQIKNNLTRRAKIA